MEYNDDDKARRWKIGGGTTVVITVSALLVWEFSERGQLGWNVFLFLFLATVVAGAIVLQRYFVSHSDEIGEARFDTRNKGD